MLEGRQGSMSFWLRRLKGTRHRLKTVVLPASLLESLAAMV
jgi:hypothetical protein